DFLMRLKIALNKTDCKCLAFCLMPNHFHLLILRGERPLAELMRRLMTGYAVSFNLRYKRAGHLFQNRYKAILCDKEEYFKELIAYIHLNPLRAAIVDNFEGLQKYKWCGHGNLIGRYKSDFMERDYVLSHFGKSENSAEQNYKNFIKERNGKYKRGAYCGGGLVRSMGGVASTLACAKSGEKELFDDRILGNGRFVESILKEVKEMPQAQISLKEIMKEACEMTGIGREEILSGSKERKAVRARSLYCYLAKEQNRVKGVDLMRELGLTCGAISRLTARGKDLYKKLKEEK
ncbi:MAG: transposase, partial [Elusimicrobiota bacterium]|nr:transposase [Elusimicrobiota bacterium]